MNRDPRYKLMVLLLVVIAGCQIMKLIPFEQNRYLPLAEGNVWNYSDSLFIMRGMDTLDTIVTPVAFEVVRQGYVDYREEGEKKFKRLEGFELVYRAGSEKIHFAVRPGSNGIRFLGFQRQKARGDENPVYTCNYFPESLYDKRNLLETETIAPDSFDIAPLMLIGCFPSKGFFSDYYFFDNTTFKFSPGTFTLSRRFPDTTISTPFGVVDAANFGHQLWAEQTGMVSARMEFNNLFWVTPDSVIQLRLIRTRTLQDYSSN